MTPCPLPFTSHRRQPAAMAADDAVVAMNRAPEWFTSVCTLRTAYCVCIRICPVSPCGGADWVRVGAQLSALTSAHAPPPRIDTLANMRAAWSGIQTACKHAARRAQCAAVCIPSRAALRGLHTPVPRRSAAAAGVDVTVDSVESPLLAEDKNAILGVYARQRVHITHGSGCWLFDHTGRRLLGTSATREAGDARGDGSAMRDLLTLLAGAFSTCARMRARFAQISTAASA